MVNQAYKNAIVKYDILYNSIVPELKGKIISKESIDKNKLAAVHKHFPFTRPQPYFI